MAECVGKCNSDWRRAEHTGQPHDLTPTLGQPIWCPKDTANILTVLDDLPALWDQLEADKGRRTGDPSERVDSSGNSLSPSPEHDEQDELLRLLWSWEDAIRDLRAMTLRPGRRPDLTRALRFHAVHGPWALEQPPVAADYGQELLRKRARLRGRTRTGSGTVAKGLPCPRCEQRRLVHELGSDYIVCQNGACGRMLTLAEYDGLIGGVAA